MASPTTCSCVSRQSKTQHHAWLPALNDVITLGLHRSCGSYIGYQCDSGWKLSSVLVFKALDDLHHSICQIIASSLPHPVVVIVFGRRTVSSAQHHCTSQRLCIVCCRTKNLEQSAYTSPSAWFVTWQFLANVSSRSRSLYMPSPFRLSVCLSVTLVHPLSR